MAIFWHNEQDLIEAGCVECTFQRGNWLMELGLPVFYTGVTTRYIPAWLYYLCTLHDNEHQPRGLHLADFLEAAHRLKDDVKGQKLLLLEGKILGNLPYPLGVR